MHNVLIPLPALLCSRILQDNIPYDRPPSLSVQQEFLLRNGSIRGSNASSSSGINKSSLRTGADSQNPAGDMLLQALDLSADLSHAEFHNEEEEEEELHIEREGTAGRSVASKVVVQCQKQFGENIKKVWKFDLPLELSARCIRDMTSADNDSPNKRAMGKSPNKPKTPLCLCGE